ncbi:hypothetical protein GCM10022409_33370 [Hymenobacter glaciei]|uniref:Uncharacterized protein n=1 Tax=Hymenobacter glaciei TaxID=877209 RepID=A0ABP7UJ60_9BACT
MSLFLRTFLCSLALASFSKSAFAQTPAERVLVVSPVVGEVIDGAEKARFGLFPYYMADDFQEARFVRVLAPDSSITLRTRLRDGRLVARPFTAAEFQAAHDLIERRQRELDANPQPAAGVFTPAGQATPEQLGSTYSVELRSGNTFIGVLQTVSIEELEFATKDLGVVRVQRTNLKRMVLLTSEQAAKGYGDVGNGTRLFFAPTARNLRRGEGYLQDIDIYLIGVNYGVTDNISVGALVPIIPGIGGNVFAITPKVSVAITEKFHVGGGALYARAFGYGGGVAYGVGTYGSADDNVTAGLGYGFADGFEGSTSPILLLGGAKRLSRSFSFLTETYIASGGFLGLIGGRLQGDRYGGSLGFIYGTEVGGIYPAYLEMTYRFGKHK